MKRLFASPFGRAVTAFGVVIHGNARALGNRIGNRMATVVTAAWEGDIDWVRARQVLGGEVTTGTAVILGAPLAEAHST